MRSVHLLKPTFPNSGRRGPAADPSFRDDNSFVRRSWVDTTRATFSLSLAKCTPSIPLERSPSPRRLLALQANHWKRNATHEQPRRHPATIRRNSFSRISQRLEPSAPSPPPKNRYVIAVRVVCRTVFFRLFRHFDANRSSPLCFLRDTIIVVHLFRHRVVTLHVNDR